MDGDGPTVGGALIQNADYICFTGSTGTGRLVAKQCADRLIGCSLELGGKNPMLVLRDADLERPPRAPSARASRTPASSASRWSGCSSPTRSTTRFVERFVARTEAMSACRPALGWGVDMGSLISQAQLDTVTRPRRGRRRQGRHGC